MALYYVLPRCGVFRPGSYVEDGADGMVQQIDVAQENGRLVPLGYKGLIVPMDMVRNDLVKVQKYGLDFKNRW